MCCVSISPWVGIAICTFSRHWWLDCGVLPSVRNTYRPWQADSSFCVRSRLSFFLCQEKRSGLRCVTFLFRVGSESPVVRSHSFVRLSDLFGSLRDCAFFAGDSDGVTTGAGYTKRNAAMCDVPFDMDCLFDMIPRGERWGLRAPKPAPKSFQLSGLSSFDSRQSTL